MVAMYLALITLIHTTHSYTSRYTTKRSSRDDAVKAAAHAYNAALSADQGENYIVGKSGGKLGK